MPDRLTRAETRLMWLMRVYAALFVLAGLCYFFLPNTTLAIANAISRAVGGLPPIPLSTERFWLVLAFSMLLTLAFLAYVAQRDVRRGRVLVAAILVCK